MIQMNTQSRMPKCLLKTQHSQNQLKYICLNGSCLGRPLICSKCIQEQHRKGHHILTIEEFKSESLAVLSMNSTRNGHHHQFVQQLKKTKQNLSNRVKQIETLMYSIVRKLKLAINNQFETIIQSYNPQTYINQLQDLQDQLTMKKVISLCYRIHVLNRNQLGADVSKVVSAEHYYVGALQNAYGRLQQIGDVLTSLKYFHELTLPDGSHSQLNKKNGNNSHILNGNHNNNIDGANQNNGHARIHSNHNNNHNSSHNNSHNNTRKQNEYHRIEKSEHSMQQQPKQPDTNLNISNINKNRRPEIKIENVIQIIDDSDESSRSRSRDKTNHKLANTKPNSPNHHHLQGYRQAEESHKQKRQVKQKLAWKRLSQTHVYDTKVKNIQINYNKDYDDNLNQQPAHPLKQTSHKLIKKQQAPSQKQKDQKSFIRQNKQKHQIKKSYTQPKTQTEMKKTDPKKSDIKNQSKNKILKVLLKNGQKQETIDTKPRQEEAKKNLTIKKKPTEQQRKQEQTKKKENDGDKKNLKDLRINPKQQQKRQEEPKMSNSINATPKQQGPKRPDRKPTTMTQQQLKDWFRRTYPNEDQIYSLVLSHRTNVQTNKQQYLFYCEKEFRWQSQKYLREADETPRLKQYWDAFSKYD